jgi:hypothetical protein
MGTWCQVCGLPVQHDHYVPEKDGDGLFIYRGGSENWGSEPAVAFGPEHDWLLRAVGVRVDLKQQPALIEGEIHDGRFYAEPDDPESGFVDSGIFERAALHRVCWELAGQPNPWLLEERVAEDVRPYCAQLFDFAALVGDAKGWMLVDPRLDSQQALASRARILDLARSTWVGRMPLPGSRSARNGPG